MKKELLRKQVLNYSLVLVIFFLFFFSGSFSYIGNAMSSRIQGGKDPLTNILIIEIDDVSINEIGRWPWPRDKFAILLEKLDSAKVVGLDISFFEPSQNDSYLIRALEKNKNVVLSSEVSEIFSMPIFNSSTGYANLKTDSDGITRTVETGLNENILPFAFEIYSKYSNSKKEYPKKEYAINFVNSPGSFDSISFSEALAKNISVKNKIVLVGATAPNLHDNYFVPTSNGVAMSGVEIHANVLQNLVLDNFLTKQSKSSTLILILLSSFVSFFLLSKLKVHYLVLFFLFLILLYFLGAVLILNNFNYLLDLFYLPLAILVFTGTGLAVNYFEEKKHSEHIKDAFGKYISKDLLEEIIHKRHELKLGGAKREITVFFSDIRGFTSISEKLSPEELVHLINEYLTEMTKIILEHKGTVDKFIGDAIMAFWNAPLLEKEHALLSCKSAIAQVNSLKSLQKTLEKRSLPKIDIGCGIHTGEAVIGNLGSDERFDYTAMGDTVNLASRLEGLTKQYGVHIIISESTNKKLEGVLPTRKLDLVKVKGKKIPIAIYELLCFPNEKLKEQYEKALLLYFKREFLKAKEEFSKIKNDAPSFLFIKRCNEYLESPPSKDWDGSFEMKTK